MKKIFFSFVALVAMFLMTGCGGSDGGSSSGGYSGGGNYSECSYGSYQCKGGDSYWCGYTGGSNDLTWQLSEYCSYSCDDSTGKCSSSSSGGNGNEQHNDSCGNRIVDSNEVCDGDAKECSTISSLYTGGYAVCNSNCSGYDTSSCATGGGSDGGGSSGGSGDCYDIYECFFQCETDSCAQACFDNGSESGQSQFYDLYTCWQNNSCEYTDCDACYAKYSACVGGGNSGGGSGGGGNTTECTSGEYRCNGNTSFYCSGGYWDSGTYCSNGCNSSTGQCNSSSGGGGSTTECTSGKYRCNGNTSFYCSGGYWDSGTYCSDGCNSSTGKCKSSSSSDCTSGQYKCIDNSSYKCSYSSWTWNQDCSYGCDLSKGKCYECSNSDYKCSGNDSYYCKSGYWVSNEYCSKGCDSSTGKCKGYKPCISSFSGGFYGSSYLKLSWSTTTSGNCGKAEKTTLYFTNGSQQYYAEPTGSSFSFDAEPYFSSSSSIGAVLGVENSYGETSEGLICEYDNGWGTCKKYN